MSTLGVIYRPLQVLLLACNTACIISSVPSGSLQGSDLAASSNVAAADGVASITVTAHLRRAGRPLVGLTVRFEADACQVTQPIGPTDATGSVSASITSTHAGTHRVRAAVILEDYKV